MEMSRNKYNLRKYLRGGVYRNIFKEKCNMIDVRDYGGRLDLNIKISENEYSIFKIRDISHHSLALRKIKRFIFLLNPHLVMLSQKNRGKIVFFCDFLLNRTFSF